MFGYFWSHELSQRNPGKLCSESPDRCLILAPDNVLPEDGIWPFSFTARDESILLNVHTEEYVRKVQRAHADGRRMLDRGNTPVTPDVYPQALLSASAGCAALDKILRGELFAAFCAVRPPGHHANRHRALGFCIFNNAAIAARYAQRRYGVGKILIVDWDAHAGNGTQEIFWEDPGVFVLSFHQGDLFAESARAGLIGEGAGKGFNRNVPFAPKTSAAEYLETFERVVTEVVEKFQPELLILSAGFDAHKRDLIAKLQLEDEDFARMTRIVVGATQPFTRNRTLSLLEGGYNLSSLSSGVAAHCLALHEIAGQTQPARAAG